jgi:quinol monooxygenase YgiN
MTIEVIVELKAKPGRRDELKALLAGLIETVGPDSVGFLGSRRYEVLDDPDMLIEIAEWESTAARDSHMKEASSTGAFAPLLDLLAAPFRATVIRELR